MKKIILGILLLSRLPLFSQQSANTITLGLQQAIDMGLKNRYDVQSKKYNVATANSELDKSKKEWIADISGSGNIRYSPQLQSTFIPGGFFTPDPSLVALGAKSTAVFGLDLNQPLYKPGIATDIKIAKNNVQLVQEQNRQNENTVKEQIVFAYLNVLLKDLQYKMAFDEEKRYQAYQEVVQGKYKHGTVIESDYLKAMLDYENTKVETQKAKQNYKLALATIKYQMNIPAGTELLLIDTLNSPTLNQLQMEIKPDSAKRTEIKQLLLRKEAAQLQIDKTKQFALPTVSLYGNYSRQFTNMDLDLSQGKWWTPFNYVGLRMSVPITGNLKNKNSIEEYQFKAAQADLDLKQKLSDVEYEIQKTAAELVNAKENMLTTGKNYDLSKKVYAGQEQEYIIGSKPYVELLETNRSLNLAEQNYIKAVYDFLISTVNYQKAIGNY